MHKVSLSVCVQHTKSFSHKAKHVVNVLNGHSLVRKNIADSAQNE